jgi:hypothetical protein
MSILLLSFLGLAIVFTQYTIDTGRARFRDVWFEAFLRSGVLDAGSLENRILGLPGAGEVEFIDKARAKEIFLSHYPDQEGLFDLFDEIPFPESFRVRPKDHWLASGLSGYLKRRLEAVPGIDEVVWIGPAIEEPDPAVRTLVLLDIALFMVIGLILVYFGSMHRAKAGHTRRDILLYLGLSAAGSIVLVSLCALVIGLSLDLSPLRFYLALPYLPVAALASILPGLLTKGNLP